MNLPEYKKRLNALRKNLSSAMGSEKHSLRLEINRLERNSKKADAPLQHQFIRLEKRIQASISKLKKRRQNIPKLIYNDTLPITLRREEIVERIAKHQVVIISGETGSGKTTQIPKFCIEAGRGVNGKIACTQPRRIAAINVANRLAQEMEEELGNSVGYKIRFANKTAPDSYIKIMTDGILLAETQNDPFLNEYDTIIVDEAHERSLNIDFILGIVNRLLKNRKDLKLIITSATIDTEKFSKAFNNAPIIEVSGRAFPVELIYNPPMPEGGSTSEEVNYVEHAVQSVLNLHRRGPYGDILTFMPTEADIRETCEMLEGQKIPGIRILPLFARLSASEQARVFSSGAGRKIIVSTNVAETSITIPGIKYVVDTGLARISRYTPRTRTTALPVTRISQSSANQRMGRCGRVENGVCIRLYEEEDFDSRPFFTAPEIIRANLSEVILRMTDLNLGNINAFPFIDSPSPASIKDGYDNLLELGAISRKSGKNGGFVLTARGKIMASLPVDPKLSRILIEAQTRGCLKEAIIIVSALSIADPRQRPPEKAQHADQQHAKFKDPASDFLTLLNIWKAFQSEKKKLKTAGKLRKFCKEHFLSFKKLREMQDIHFQITETLKENKISKNATGLMPAADKDKFSPLYTAIHKSILSGYLSNIAMKKEKNIFNATKGRQVMLFPGSGLFKKADQFIVAAEMVETSQLFARTAANIDQQWLEEIGGELCRSTFSNPHWEQKRGEVTALEQVTLFGIVIVSARKISYARIDPEEASEIFIRSALVEEELDVKLPFIKHNRKLMNEILTMEDKMRVRNIMISDEDLYLFYRNRLENFSDIRTFAKFLKDKGDDKFLRMKKEDLLSYTPDNWELELYPDKLNLGGKAFTCDYNFMPGNKKDGVTVCIPASEAESIPSESLDWLVPGLYSEKITALLRGLPKQYRKRLVPITDTSKIISVEMPRENRSLYTSLSHFIHKRFNVNIPASIWSDKDIPEHLNMRISINDSRGKEIKSGRSKAILKSRSEEVSLSGIIEDTRKKWEKTGITQWDFADMEESIEIRIDENNTLTLYPALAKEDGQLALRLFESKAKAAASHMDGVEFIFSNHFSKEMKALKKDITLPSGDKNKANYFGGPKVLEKHILKRISRDLFRVPVRTAKGFSDHASHVLPKITQTGRSLFKSTSCVINAYHEARSMLFSLETGIGGSSELLNDIRKRLDKLVPEKFAEIYSHQRIRHLERYIKALAIRAQRGVDAPEKDRQKALQVEEIESLLETMVEALTPEVSDEKKDALEDYFWTLEEYKVSVFAQELKTVVKVSKKRLEKSAAKIQRMI